MGNIPDAPHRDGWPDFSRFRPHPPAAMLAAWLTETQAMTDRLFGVIDAGRLDVPRLRIVNPPLWELGHIAWFQEFWTHRRGAFAAASLLPGADKLYDSARAHHDTRWSLALPDLVATRAFVTAILERSLELLARGPLTDELAYFVQLSILHQDMHNEAFCYMWQTLGYPMPAGLPVAECRTSSDSDTGDIEIPSGRMTLGAAPESGFVFDNEKWAHEIELQGFAIARRPVSNGEFRCFVDERGYGRREFWSDAGARMVADLALKAPRYWRKEGDGWRVRRFDRVIALEAREPVMHVSFHEAEAYCRWSGRRLPSEAEWERAATNWPQLPGKAWEWTSSRFAPYPGFSIDPYREYSEPWFVEDHRVLRGGSFITPPRLIRRTWRNFYLPARADMFCGFRTCAP